MQWHDLSDPKDPRLDQLAAEYHIHPLHVEDCRNRSQRAKLEEGDGYLFAVLKPVQVNGDGDLDFTDLDLFLGSDWVITVQEGRNDGAKAVLQKVHAVTTASRPDQVFYRICDGIVDSYLPIIDHVDDVIDNLEDEVLQTPDPAVLSRIFHTKRILIELRRILVNTRDLTGHLVRVEHQLIAPDLHPFFRDVYDHVARNLDLVETQRDLLTGDMDVYLSSVANRTNQVMKVLTILGTVALPIIVISGYFGMNTKDLPLTNSPHGTVIATLIMALSTAALLFLLKRFRWF